MSFFKFNWVKENFLFLQTDLGKGAFDLFIATLLLVDLSDGWNVAFGSVFAVVGIATIVLSTCCKPEGVDPQEEEIKAQAAKNLGEDSESAATSA